MIWETLFWLLPILVLVWWIPQNAQHESAHAVAVMHWGGDILRFWPFPGRMSDGHWSWAHVEYRWTNGRPDITADGVVSIAPQFLNTVTLLVLLSISRWDIGLIPNTILCALYITNYIDGAYNLSTFYRKEPEVKRTDGWEFQHCWQIPVWLCRVGTVCWQAFFLVHLLVPVSIL